MQKSVKKNILTLLVFTLSLCVAFAISMLSASSYAKAELMGFGVSEEVTFEYDETGANLRFRIEVDDSWILENPSESYVFGALIYPATNGNYDQGKTLQQNEDALDSVNIVLRNGDSVSASFIYTPALRIDFKKIGEWVLKVKPDYSNDENSFTNAIMTVYERLSEIKFTVVGYAITDNGDVITTAEFSTSINEVQGGGGSDIPPEVDTNVGADIVGEEVTEEEFYNAVAFEGVTSYSASGVSTGVTHDYDEYGNAVPMPMPAMAVSLEVEDNKSNYYLAGMKIQYEIVEGTIYAYVPSQDQYGNLITMRVSIGTVDTYSAPSTIGKYTREQINFDDFTFVDGCYVGTAVDSMGQSSGVTYKFVDGKVAFVQIDTVQDGIDTYMKLVLDYTPVTVTLPTDYVDGGSATPPSSSAEWMGLFNFDNVTVKSIDETTYADKNGAVKYSNNDASLLMLNGNEWIFHKEDVYANRYLYDDLYVYCGGSMPTINGVEAPECQRLPYEILMDADYGEYENYFTQESEGYYVFENEHQDEELKFFAKIEITVINGKLDKIVSSSKMEYLVDTYSANAGDVVEDISTYIFTDWGNTVVNADGAVSVKSTWNDYFDMSNVTVTENQVALVGNERVDTSNGATWEIAGGEWICKMIRGANDYGDGVYFIYDKIFFDGAGYYYNGVYSEEPLDNYFNAIVNYGDLCKANKDAFTITTEGNTMTLTADELEYQGAKIWDVTITIVDGKITKIVHVIPNGYAVWDEEANDTIEYPVESTVTFTNHGTTVVDADAYFDETKWHGYLNYGDNVTMSCIEKESQTGETRRTTTKKKDGEKWYFSETYKISDEETVSGSVTFDGEKHNYEGEAHWGNEDNIEVFIESFVYVASPLVKTGDNTYHASSIRLYSGELLDVTVTVENGKVSKITYKEVSGWVSDENGIIEYYYTYYTYNFYNVGSTIV